MFSFVGLLGGAGITETVYGIPEQEGSLSKRVYRVLLIIMLFCMIQRFLDLLVYLRVS